MIAAAAAPGDAIRVDLTLPVTRIGFGIFSIDPLEQLIGARVVDLLEPLLVGPVARRPSESGAAIEVYPLALPDGEGATIPLGSFGEVGFRNERSILVLTVPWGMGGWVAKRLGDAVVRGPVGGLSIDGCARVAELWVRLRPGMRVVVPLGALGEAGVEAG